MLGLQMFYPCHSKSHFRWVEMHVHYQQVEQYPLVGSPIQLMQVHRAVHLVHLGLNRSGDIVGLTMLYIVSIE